MPIYKSTTVYRSLTGAGLGWTRSLYTVEVTLATARSVATHLSALELELMSTNSARTHSILSDVAVAGDADITTYDETLHANQGSLAGEPLPPNMCLLFTPRTSVFSPVGSASNVVARGYLRVHGLAESQWVANNMVVSEPAVANLVAYLLPWYQHRYQFLPTASPQYVGYVSVSGPQMATRRVGRPLDDTLLRQHRRKLPPA